MFLVRHWLLSSDADLIVWDPAGSRVISAETHHQNIDFNIYEGMEVTGLPTVTISRGSVVWQDGELKTVKGAGKYVNRPCFAPYHDAIGKTRELNTPTSVDRS
jgi:dihydropyrimidinase